MLFLNVPFVEKDQAKALGARWNPEKKKWYVPEGVDTAPFFLAGWAQTKEAAASGETLAAIPKSANAKKSMLFVDLVPNSAWFSNLRSELTKDEWDLVKKATFRAANYLCEVCGGRGPNHPVECHERWHYDAGNKVQTLIGTISLCPACHEATHYGLARVKGRDSEARQHLMQVNGWNDGQAMSHIHEAMDEWKRRSEIKWKLDARWLLDFVALSEGTRKKIVDHAAGLGERRIEDWQNDVVRHHARQAGIGRPA